MKFSLLIGCTKTVFLIFFLLFSASFYAQNNSLPKAKSDFWKDVRFGGALGLGIGNGFTNIVVAPSAIYNFNQYVSAGLVLKYVFIQSIHCFTLQ